MATVTTRYRCPVSPDECPSSPRGGFCEIHEWEQLVPQRAYLTAESPSGDGAAGAAAGPGDGGPETPGEGHGEPGP
ncbi:hypothetical protein GT042_10395, partial [Streptomyces sp. SID3212]|nr:hypothetical protein [Streptomyces sp. SID3212]